MDCLALVFKNASNEDLPEILRVFQSSILSSCHKDYNEEQLRAWIGAVANTERWKTAIQEQYFLLAFIGGSLAGFASISKEGLVDFFFLDSPYQGKGIASKLYTQLEAQAEQYQLNFLHSFVSKTAKPFFESRGFEVEYENQASIKGVELTNYKMNKYL